jgi:short-subunit dehydrogenase involved in D-alanine esterification of teichoic acids
MGGTSVPGGFVADLLRLDEKVVLVTGGASGLGEAMACGLNVLVNDLPVFRETLGSLAKFSDLSAFCKDDIMDALKAKKPKDELIEFSNRYSVENHAKKLNEIYSDVKN